MASKAVRKEWADYFNSDMEPAILAGELDDVLRPLMKSLTKRLDFIEGTGGKASGTSSEELVTKMVGVATRRPGYFDPFPRQYPAKWYNLSDIVGKVVKINDRCRPKYLRGVEVKVINFKQKNFTVEVVDPARLTGRSFDSVFGLPPSLIDIEWK